MTEDDPLDDILEQFDETKETSQNLSQYQKQTKKAKQELAQKVTRLEDEEEISTTKAEAILNQVQNANYGKGRQMLKEAYEKQGLEFDADEKNLFAQKFTDEFEQLQGDTERIRNSLLQLERGVDRDDLITYLYGKHSSFTKSDLRAVFDALGKVGKSSFSTKDQARVLAAFDSDLGITTTKEILDEIKKEADSS
jgi:phenylpyruvate tautomerase PptA (4-oxalocrotonate tautomerase family)